MNEDFHLPTSTLCVFALGSDRHTKNAGPRVNGLVIGPISAWSPLDANVLELGIGLLSLISWCLQIGARGHKGAIGGLACDYDLAYNNSHDYMAHLGDGHDDHVRAGLDRRQLELSYLSIDSDV